MPFDIESILRLLTIGASLLLLVLIATGEIRKWLRIAIVGMLVGASCYLINSAPQFSLDRPIRLGLDIFSVFTPFWMWLFARLLFEREPSRRLVGLAIASLAVPWLVSWAFPNTDPFGFLVIHVAGLALLGDLVFTAWSGREDDLIEKRRLIRLWLPLLVALQAGGILIYELIYGTDTPLPGVTLLNSLSILALTIFAGAALLRTDPELLVETVRKSKPSDRGDDLSPSEIVLREKLEAAMASGAYRTPGLTIATFARQLETPEHRLRALINQRLGFRNFSAYLNGHRIEEAQAILADRSRVDLPVLTIAMDLGYNSLPTFNRAFRELTDRTPTEFRRESIEQN